MGNAHSERILESNLSLERGKSPFKSKHLREHKRHGVVTVKLSGITNARRTQDNLIAHVISPKGSILHGYLSRPGALSEALESVGYPMLTPTEVSLSDSRAHKLLVTYAHGWHAIPFPEIFSRHSGTCLILGDRNISSAPFAVKTGDCFRLGSVGLVVSEMRAEGNEETRIDEKTMQFLKDELLAFDAQEDMAILAADEERAAASQHNNVPAYAAEDLINASAAGTACLDSTNQSVCASSFDASMRGGIANGEKYVCYMCYETHNTVEDALVAPCECKGDTRYLHVQCLQKWYHSTVSGAQAQVIRTTGSGAPACKICGCGYKTTFRRQDGRKANLLEMETDGPYLSLVVVTKHDTHPALFNTKFRLNFGRMANANANAAGALEDDGNSIIIGRSSTCNMILDYRTVSTVHAKITYQDGKFFLSDKRSSNGTMVYLQNPLPLPYATPVRLRMGRTTVTVQAKRTWTSAVRSAFARRGASSAGDSSHYPTPEELMEILANVNAALSDAANNPVGGPLSHIGKRSNTQRTLNDGSLDDDGGTAGAVDGRRESIGYFSGGDDGESFGEAERVSGVDARFLFTGRGSLSSIGGEYAGSRSTIGAATDYPYELDGDGVGLDDGGRITGSNIRSRVALERGDADGYDYGAGNNNANNRNFNPGLARSNTEDAEIEGDMFAARSTLLARAHSDELSVGDAPSAASPVLRGAQEGGYPHSSLRPLSHNGSHLHNSEDLAGDGSVVESVRRLSNDLVNDTTVAGHTDRLGGDAGLGSVQGQIGGEKSDEPSSSKKVGVCADGDGSWSSRSTTVGAVSSPSQPAAHEMGHSSQLTAVGLLGNSGAGTPFLGMSLMGGGAHGGKKRGSGRVSPMVSDAVAVADPMQMMVRVAKVPVQRVRSEGSDTSERSLFSMTDASAAATAPSGTSNADYLLDIPRNSNHSTSSRYSRTQDQVMNNNSSMSMNNNGAPVIMHSPRSMRGGSPSMIVVSNTADGDGISLPVTAPSTSMSVRGRDMQREEEYDRGEQKEEVLRRPQPQQTGFAIGSGAPSPMPQLRSPEVATSSSSSNNNCADVVPGVFGVSVTQKDADHGGGKVETERASFEGRSQNKQLHLQGTRSQVHEELDEEESEEMRILTAPTAAAVFARERSGISMSVSGPSSSFSGLPNGGGVSHGVSKTDLSVGSNVGTAKGEAEGANAFSADQR